MTSDGASPSPDGKGSEGYVYPSQSDDGEVIVAVRNQAGSTISKRGYLWVMNRRGDVLAKLNPPQFTWIEGVKRSSSSPRGLAAQTLWPGRSSPAPRWATRPERASGSARSAISPPRARRGPTPGSSLPAGGALLGPGAGDLAGDVPVAGQYDADPAVERAVFRDGAWYGEGQPAAYFGLGGDVPLAIPSAVYGRSFPTLRSPA